MKRNYTRATGFTIVELLITVTVIGILATIVVTSYGRAQAQSRNTQVAEHIKAYKKALLAYATQNGSYPVSTAACLGTGYPDLDGNATAGDCETWNGSATIFEDSAFNTALRPYVGGTPTLPNAKFIVRGDGLGLYGGAFVHVGSVTLDGAAHPWWLIYIQEGSSGACPVGPVATISAWPALTSTRPSSGYTEAHGSDARRCWVALPNPARL